MTNVSRRRFVAGSVTTLLAGAAFPLRAGASTGPPNLHPRSEWTDRSPTAPLQREEDVRILLVHHTDTPNGYQPADVPARLRSIFDFHTGTKGWPDVAYNFFVDAHGHVWEGREGSIAGAVRGDATGGSQGHAVLCCFVGSHQIQPPSGRAIEAMAATVAWQSYLHGVDLWAGPTISFESRGSNRWPAGTQVVTDPVAGHRDMSQSACPGDAAYPLVRGAILERAQRLLVQLDPARGPVVDDRTPSSTTVEMSPSSSTTTVPSAVTTVRPPPTDVVDGPTKPPDTGSDSEGDDSGDGSGAVVMAAAIGGASVLGAAGVVRLVRRSRHDAVMDGPDEPDAPSG